MPLYEYECTECKRHTEKIQKFSDPEITQCPHCGGKLERVISAPAIAFKGGGWYADGYGNAKPSAGKSDESSAKSDAGTTKNESGSSISAASESPASSSKEASSAPASAAPSTPAPVSTPATSSSEKK
jgi:putative FmdB family regulatory protein